MKNILIIYIIVINLAGFFIMGIDKRRAKRERWRVSERTLFLIALLCGSIGVLVGMYVFRHKTRRPAFVLGIPAILILQLLLVGLLCVWNSRRLGSPSRAVQRELELIRELDSTTIQAFVSYENLMNPNLDSDSDSSGAAEAVALFFRNFKYDIQKEHTDGDQSVVDVAITNVDMRALAQDLCAEILRRSVSLDPNASSLVTGDFYRLLRDTLADNTYELKETTAAFHLQKQQSGWTIQTDETLEDELVSGFISCINDPYILPSDQVLAIHLDALKALDAAGWKDYLSINDVFATYNSEYSGLIDDEYIRQLADAFDYKILRCDENGSTASAVVRITSIDMMNVLSLYKQYLLSYAATTRSLRDDAAEFSNETSRLLLQALQSNSSVASTDINIKFRNNGSVWEISFDESFTNALMGNMSEAIDRFNSVTQESIPMAIVPGEGG